MSWKFTTGILKLTVKPFFWTDSQIPVTPRPHWGIPTDTYPAMTAHQPLSSAMHSNDDIDWPVHSLMLPFHDLRGLPLRSLPLRQSIMTTGQTWPNHDNLRRSAEKAPEVQRG